LYKNKRSVIPFDERVEIVRNSRYVDLVVPQVTMDKLDAYHRYKFDVMFVGDDWYKTEKWEVIERELKNFGVKIIYFPYTANTSSTLINQTLEALRKE